MLPPEIEERARQDAAWLVQLAIDDVSVSGRDARVTGRVVRIFRGSKALLDSTLTLTVPIDRGDGGDPPRPGDRSRTPLEQLRPGRVLEAYLDDSEQGPQITLDLSVVLDAATDEARLPVLLAPAAAPPPARRLGRIIAALIAALLLGALALVLR